MFLVILLQASLQDILGLVKKLYLGMGLQHQNHFPRSHLIRSDASKGLDLVYLMGFKRPLGLDWSVFVPLRAE